MNHRFRAFRAACSAACGFSCLVLAACDNTPPPAANSPPAVEVEIVQVATTDIPVVSQFVGRTESSQRVEIRSRVPGFLDEIAYEEGGFVEEGAVLFRIDPSPLQSQLRAAEAELAQQQARLENAQAQFNRIEPLARAEAVAQKDLDDAEGRLREAAAAVEVAKARVFDAELNLGYATVTAPVSGLAGQSQQREGAFIGSAANQLTDVAKVDPMWVEFTISESQLLRAIRTGSSGKIVYPSTAEFEVMIELADGTTHPNTGRISFTDASVSTKTGTVLIRAEVPNPDQTLRPGQFVRVFLSGAFRPNAMVVPQRAVKEGPKGPYIWVVDREGKAEQRPVQLGPWHEDTWIIEEGVRENDRIIVNGGMRLQPGRPVTVGRILTISESIAEGRNASPAGSPDEAAGGAGKVGTR